MTRRARTKNLPHLHEFLEESAANPIGFDGFAGSTLMAAAVLSGVVGFGLLELLGPFRAVLLTALVVLPVLVVGISAIRSKMRPRKSVEESRREQSALLYRGLWREAQQTKKLHRRLNPMAAALLEESASNWLRVKRSLAGPLWQSDQLPAHWRQVRDRSLWAAGHAMSDLGILVQPYLRQLEGPKPGFAQVVDDIVEAMMPSEAPLPAVELLPAEFDPARRVAERLKLLASEVELASRELVLEPSATQHMGSTEAIEGILGELRAIRQAETELRQQVSGQD